MGLISYDLFQFPFPFSAENTFLTVDLASAYPSIALDGHAGTSSQGPSIIDAVSEIKCTVFFAIPIFDRLAVNLVVEDLPPTIEVINC